MLDPVKEKANGFECLKNKKKPENILKKSKKKNHWNPPIHKERKDLGDGEKI